MPLKLLQVNEENRPLWERVAQLYLHDMSELTGSEPGLDGRFPSHLFDADENLLCFVVLLRSKPAGLVSFRSCQSAIGSRNCLDDFFIMRCYRRLGIGEEVARMVFDQFQGNWQVEVGSDNDVGKLFWRQVIRRYTFKHCRELSTNGGEGLVFEFTSPPPENAFT